MTGREIILTNIRLALGRGRLSAEAAMLADGYISQHPPGPIPARSSLAREPMADLFVSMAEGVSTTVERLADPGAILPAVLGQLPKAGISRGLAVAPHPLLKSLNWKNYDGLAARFGNAQGSDQVALTVATAGVAETGTLVFVSGPECPSDHCFLPEIQIAVLRQADLVGSYEEIWRRLRDGAATPATINFVTGPSRTGDIEQTIQLGAHGPRRLHILLLG